MNLATPNVQPTVAQEYYVRSTCESKEQHLAHLFSRLGCWGIPPVTGNAG
jgi:hypothetical protein